MIPKSLQFIFFGGKLVTKTIVATAGNVVTNLSPPDGRRWIVLFGRLTIVCDANAANRQFALALTDGTNVLFNYPSSPVMTANETKSLGLISDHTTWGTFTEKDKAILGIGKVVIEKDDQLRITIDNGLAGDSYSGFVRVLEVNV